MLITTSVHDLYTALVYGMCIAVFVCTDMGGGAGPAGQVLAGPLFCLIDYSQNERRFLGLNLFLINHRHFFSLSR